MYLIKLFSFVLFSVWLSLEANIHILFSSAIIEDQATLRKEEYLTSYFALKDYGFEPWIIEATNVNFSFFDDLSDRVFYPQKNNLSLKNLGVNEIESIRAVLAKLPFDDEDIVIKLTGRYFLYDQFFIELIQNNFKYDVFAKQIEDQVFTGCIAMKWKYFKKIIMETDLQDMEKNMINMEKVFYDFILKENLCFFHVDKLHLLARIYGRGKGRITYDW